MIMEAQAMNGTNGKNGTINPRGDFSDREKEFIIIHAGKPGWSWGSIARALGKLFPEDNGGKRTREGVRIFATRDPDRPVNIFVPIQASLVEAARKKGIDPGTVLAKALTAEILGGLTYAERAALETLGNPHTDEVQPVKKKPDKKPSRKG